MPLERFLMLFLTIIGHAISLSIITTPKYTLKKSVLVWLGVIGFSELSMFILFQIIPNELVIIMAISFVFCWIASIWAFFYLSNDSLGKNIFIFVSYTDLFFFLAFIPLFISPTNAFIQISIRMVFYIIFWLLYIKYVRKPFNKVTDSLKKGWVPINIMAFLFLIFLFYTTFISIGANSQWDKIVEFLFIGLIIIAANVVTFKTISYQHQLSEVEQFINNEKYLVSQIKTLQNVDEQAKRIRHDIRHHNLHISQYAKNNDIEGLLKYLGEYQDEEDHYQIHKFCENNIVNSIVSVYIDKAKENGIEIEVDVILNNEIHIKESDMVSILANLLENAINGCLISQENNKVITIKIYKKSNKIVITCINPCCHHISFIDGIPQSTHGGGLGVKNIIYAASKYEGEYSFYQEDDVYKAKILLNDHSPKY